VITQRKNYKWGWAITILIFLFSLGIVGCNQRETETPTLAPSDTPIPSETTIPLLTATTEPTPTLAPPAKPVLDPRGPEITVDLGEVVAIRVSAEGATDYEWVLVGDGQLSGTGEATLYTAPKEDGTIAIVTVTAINDQGASPAASLTIKIGLATASVRLDALAIPAGFMSGGSNPWDYINLSTNPNECYSGGECIQVNYEPGGGWGGIFWWPSGCGTEGTTQAWNSVTSGTCGVNVLQSGNLSAVNRLVFWARGAIGGEIIEFKIGAVDILPSPGRSLGKIELSPNWVEYEIDLEGVDMSNAIALFAWIAADVDNPNGAIFYLDDIQFEGLQ